MNPEKSESSRGFDACSYRSVVLRAVVSDRYEALFNIAIVAGLRPSEYLGLQWKACLRMLPVSD